MKLEFHPEALREFELATLYYENRKAGLGKRFIASVEAALQSILDSPETWPVLEQDVRRLLTHIFPYAILYSIESEHVLVLAVMHCHQKPGYWQSRAK